MKDTQPYSSFGFPSFFIFMLSQYMKNEALNSAHVPKKLCPDFLPSCHDLQFVHNMDWLLSIKSYYVTILPNCGTIFDEAPYINFESKTTISF